MLVIAAHSSTIRSVSKWPELAQQHVEFVPIPSEAEFTMWSQDASVACEDDNRSSVMLLPARNLRAADVLVAETIATALGIRTVRADFSFEGGNILVGDHAVLIGADRVSTPAGKSIEDCFAPLADGRSVTVLETTAPLPGREVCLVGTADGIVVEERFGYVGVRQPLFHIDAFVTLAGVGPDRRERVVVGDLRLAADQIGNEQLPAKQRPVADGLDDMAARLANDPRFQVIRSSLPIIPMIHNGLKAWQRSKVASHFAGVNGIEDVLAGLDRKGLKTVPVRFWRAASQNSCLVFRHDGKDKVLLPTFAHGSNRSLARSEEFNRRLWQSMGFDSIEIPDCAPFAERNASLHCMLKLISYGGHLPRTGRAG